MLTRRWLGSSYLTLASFSQVSKCVEKSSAGDVTGMKQGFKLWNPTFLVEWPRAESLCSFQVSPICRDGLLLRLIRVPSLWVLPSKLSKGDPSHKVSTNVLRTTGEVGTGGQLGLRAGRTYGETSQHACQQWQLSGHNRKLYLFTYDLTHGEKEPKNKSKYFLREV